ncbi:hypothetical protein NPIL_486991 [Nephila pilipes]|uniref:Uncharacterized protein n=1 Tax=Nephila pilipes TaxID=299642 RepID=A0A8X6PDX0_NEPPI|nr:hypothetical protein NPIL_486991 [Nephila pilipes]
MYNPKANNMIERVYCQIKAAAMFHCSTGWVGALHLVYLVIEIITRVCSRGQCEATISAAIICPCLEVQPAVVPDALNLQFTRYDCTPKPVKSFQAR